MQLGSDPTMIAVVIQVTNSTVSRHVTATKVDLIWELRLGAFKYVQERKPSKMIPHTSNRKNGKSIKCFSHLLFRVLRPVRHLDAVRLRPEDGPRLDERDVRRVGGVVLERAGEALGGGPEGGAVAGGGVFREGEGELLHTVGEIVLKPAK